ncbi:hypothetical protein TSUD_10990 [Trifolium subterraneum]|nr:hypothetical protein TSUD_10990 [Trifolium subterraneum]
MLVGINIVDSWLAEAASVLGCTVGVIPFMYLGLPIRGDPRRLSFWDPVLNRIRNRLSSWKSRYLSFGGRLVLLKFVLTSLPVYALSFFRAPSDKSGLWYRVLRARYGEEAGRLVMGDRRGSSWWREILKIRDDESVGGTWFAESIVRRVGDGNDTFFWNDSWLGCVPLSVRFRRLYELSLHQTSTVDAMCVKGWEEGEAAWQWRRQLWAWEEEELAECKALLLNVILQLNISDRWIWRHDIENGYSVMVAYALLTSMDRQGADANSDLIWHKQVPVKVSLLVWRLFRNRLPTKDNLAARHVISLDSQLCVNGCGGLETAQHLFLSCPAFVPLWGEVSSWIGILHVASNSLSDHFVQFIHSSGGQNPTLFLADHLVMLYLGHVARAK